MRQPLIESDFIVLTQIFRLTQIFIVTQIFIPAKKITNGRIVIGADPLLGDNVTESVSCLLVGKRIFFGC